MLLRILGIIWLLGGFLGLFQTYKNRYKINITRIFFKKDVYEVVNEKELLRLKNIRFLLMDVAYISIGILGLWWSSKVYILGAIIPGASSYIFSLLGLKYVKLKEKVYL